MLPLLNWVVVILEKNPTKLASVLAKFGSEVTVHGSVHGTVHEHCSHTRVNN
ncbi:hypothetical protein SLEP1_g27579 [Rubroshorea leprosula]|uniref:Uncharacterized protein n=1 Tax=Rubroshorea leprosula TaxID=152421 RepID=A0AAV5K1M8_9ROSI|nr:hypothetical protein SLEP1_g27579 [Rubroshorea leprosula]